jgi:protein-S-isoprenylcysteine O-methyltransferase Ste14
MKHIRSILLLPGTVLVLIPGLILFFGDRVNPGWSLSPPWNLLTIGIGVLLICLGLSLMVHTIYLFIQIGKGTLAPWDPTQNLVVRGFYRYMRNPMITGVLFVLLGEAVGLGSTALLIWFIFALLVNAIYLPLSEEPGLEKRFGQDYHIYKENVPRWIPRPTPWEGSTQQDTDRYR